jgi:LysM repeat protein
MAEPTTPTPTGHSGGFKGFLTGTTAGLPNWAWILVVGGGIAAAYFLPKLLGSSSSSTTTPTTGTDTSGIGLAVDPTTGLPYAVEGLVPSGAYAGDTSGSTTGVTGTTGAPGPAGPAGPTGAAGAPGKPGTPAPTPVKKPIVVTTPVKKPTAPAPQEKYVNVQAWPQPLSTLSGIASKNGITLERLEQLNPQIKDPNLIYPNEKVRIA